MYCRCSEHVALNATMMCLIVPVGGGYYSSLCHMQHCRRSASCSLRGAVFGDRLSTTLLSLPIILSRCYRYNTISPVAAAPYMPRVRKGEKPSRSASANKTSQVETRLNGVLHQNQAPARNKYRAANMGYIVPLLSFRTPETPSATRPESAPRKRQQQTFLLSRSGLKTSKIQPTPRCR